MGGFSFGRLVHVRVPSSYHPPHLMGGAQALRTMPSDPLVKAVARMISRWETSDELVGEFSVRLLDFIQQFRADSR